MDERPVDERPMDERTRRIVRVSIELAEKGGFEGVRLRDVASHAGVALGTLYRRFRSKEELLMAALELQVQVFERRIAGSPVRGATPLARVEAFFSRITEGLCSRPNLARALLRSVQSGGPELSGRVVGFHSRIEGLIIASLRGDGGGAPPSEREQRLAQALVRVWFASLSGWVGGVHDVVTVVAETCSAAELMLGESEGDRLPRAVRSV